MKKIVISLILFLSVFCLHAQNTRSISGEIIGFIPPDFSAGTTSFAYVTATLSNPSGGQPVYISGGNVPLTQFYALDGNAAFPNGATIPANDKILPTGTKWSFSVCMPISTPCQSVPATSIPYSASQFDLGTYISNLHVVNITVPASNFVVAYSPQNGSAVLNPVQGTVAVDNSGSNTNKALYIFNANQWQTLINPNNIPPSGAAGGDLSGSYPDPQVRGWNNGIIPMSSPCLATNDLGQPIGCTGVPASGAAGGDLTGTYPNPTIGANIGYFPNHGSTIYYVDFGDSRVAGSALTSNNAPSDFILNESYFTGGKIQVVKLGYPGETACQIFANYSTTAHPYAVNGTTRTVVYIHNAMGVNDILLGNSESSAFACIQQIVTAEKADGMTVLQDTVYKIGTAPRPTATGGIVFTPSWYPSSPDASCITPVQGWTAYGPQFNQQLSMLNMDILFGTYTTAPDKILDWGNQVKDMWDVQYTCEGVHTTALVNKAWAQYVNNNLGIGTSTHDGDGYYRSVENFDAIFVGTRETINNYGDSYLNSVNVDGFPVTGFPDHGAVLGWVANISYLDSVGNGPSIIGAFDFRQAVKAYGASFDSWKSDMAGDWTGYGALNWGSAGTGTVITSSSNVCQSSGTNCPASPPITGSGFSADLAGSRSFGTVYQNTGSSMMLLYGSGTISGGAGDSNGVCLVGSTSPPTIPVYPTTYPFTVAGEIAGFNCPVPAGWFYEQQMNVHIANPPAHWYEIPLQ